MNQNSRKKPAASIPDAHVRAVGRLLTQLKKHLIKSAGQKGTYSDYLRLLEFYSHTDLVKPKQLIVTWVDPEWMKKEDNAAA
jgi:hypothetical protein